MVWIAVIMSCFLLLFFVCVFVIILCQLPKLEGAWNFSPGLGHQFNMPHSVMPQQMLNASSGPLSAMPVTPHINASSLADQLENTLHISKSTSTSTSSSCMTSGNTQALLL